MRLRTVRSKLNVSRWAAVVRVPSSRSPASKLLKGTSECLREGECPASLKPLPFPPRASCLSFILPAGHVYTGTCAYVRHLPSHSLLPLVGSPFYQLPETCAMNATHTNRLRLVYTELQQ